jgi:DNA mismatch repair protein MutS
LFYLSETQHNKNQHITSIHRIAEDAYVWMDRFTIRNLELYHSYNPNAVTLLDVIDKTLSPMGGRLLKRWLALPLKEINKIKSRHEVVAYFKENLDILQQVQHKRIARCHNSYQGNGIKKHSRSRKSNWR